MNRPNWYNPHPDACTCAACQEKRMVDERVRLVGRKVGRNEKCPCGSGKKYKKCHAA